MFMYVLLLSYSILEVFWENNPVSLSSLTNLHIESEVLKKGVEAGVSVLQNEQ